ncbi:hypothetical protein [uncultured Erythrobacter sp.]|uniref:hypothetical protein n=1 Tax=uncultured Erythrobacter sp. TaxID=263913 RepID=UPI00261FE8FB|nr:hypothetical protein [uncultured Erythrobacter sp.]
MRVLVDLVDSIGASIRFIFLMFFLAIFGFGILVTAGATYVAPKVADSVVDRADRYEDRLEQARRDRELGSEGWGYGAGSSNTRSPNADGFGEDDGSWADDYDSGYR